MAARSSSFKLDDILVNLSPSMVIIPKWKLLTVRFTSLHVVSHSRFQLCSIILHPGEGASPHWDMPFLSQKEKRDDRTKQLLVKLLLSGAIHQFLSHFVDQIEA